jgi:hypothetical protein
LIDFVETRTSWNKYKGTIEYPINGKYLNQIHNKYINAGVYTEINKQILNKYLKRGREIKLKRQTIDFSFVSNKGGAAALRASHQSKIIIISSMMMSKKRIKS